MLGILLHFGGEMIAEVIIEAAQDLFAAIEKDRFDSETIEDAGKFHGDIATAHDHHAARQALEVKGLVRGDRKFAARQMLGHEG